MDCCSSFPTLHARVSYGCTVSTTVVGRNVGFKQQHLLLVNSHSYYYCKEGIVSRSSAVEACLLFIASSARACTPVRYDTIRYDTWQLDTTFLCLTPPDDERTVHCHHHVYIICGVIRDVLLFVVSLQINDTIYLHSI